MTYLNKIIMLENEVERFSNARNSNHARPIDTTNLVDALERLRVLKGEAEEAFRGLLEEARENK